MHCKVPLVLTLHDIIFLEPREGKSASRYQNLGWLYRRFVVPRVLPDCRRIVTVSRFERDRIGRALELPEDKLVAIYNGYSSHFKPVDGYKEVTAKYTDSDRYIFFLGNTDPKKNTARILKAYSLYAESTDAPLPLLVADLNETVVEEILARQGISHIRPLLRMPGYIPNGDLPAVYSGASVFLYASLRESFGIPILESMACGTPIITSNVSAMPEIAGEGAMLVDPLDENSIAAALTSLMTDRALYAEKREYGLKRVKKFSWEKTARELLSLYEEVGRLSS
jgi:glycosyltransferase involved in cell wall biosynthesis